MPNSTFAGINLLADRAKPAGLLRMRRLHRVPPAVGALRVGGCFSAGGCFFFLRRRQFGEVPTESRGWTKPGKVWHDT